MATDYQWRKTGLHLEITTSKRALPKPLSSPIVVPDFSHVASSLIRAALETVVVSGRKGIRISMLGVDPLPTAGAWTLFHACYESTPAIIPWHAVQLGAVARVDYLIAEPLAGATHRFYLSDGTISYPEISIQTPNDLLVGITTPGGATQAGLDEVHQAALNALAAAAKSQAVADGKIDAYYQPTEPAGGDEGDLWFDTNDGNKLYSHRGGSWVATQDSSIARALEDARTAQGTADGKARIWYQASQPTGLTATDGGDLWVDTDDNNKVWAFNGTAWVLAQDWWTANAAAVKALVTGPNLIPNADSELGPLPGVPGNLVLDTGNGGYLGSRYVRALRPGGTPGSPQLVEPMAVKCYPGDRFRLSCVAKRISGDLAATYGTLLLWFVDAHGNQLTDAGAVGSGINYADYPTVQAVGEWGRVGQLVWPVAPPNAVSLMAVMTTHGDCEIWFDNLLLEKIPTLQAATATSLGLVKAGAGVSISGDGTLSVAGGTGGTSTPATWGTIGGTLASQADLQAALVNAGSRATWGSLGGTLTSQGDLGLALAAKAALAGADFTGPVSATSFTGSGSGLTGIPASAIIGGGQGWIAGSALQATTGLFSGDVNARANFWLGTDSVGSATRMAASSKGMILQLGHVEDGKGYDEFAMLSPGAQYVMRYNSQENRVRFVIPVAADGGLFGASASFSGNVVAATFSGSGAGLTGIPISSLVGAGAGVFTGGALTATSGAFSGILTASADLRIKASAYQSAPTLGSDAGTLAILGCNGLFGLYAGLSTNGDTWLQSQRNDGQSSVYRIVLQPGGGAVACGGPLSAGAFSASTGAFSGGVTAASFTGSHSGSGAGLTNIPVTSITGLTLGTFAGGPLSATTGTFSGLTTALAGLALRRIDSAATAISFYDTNWPSWQTVMHPVGPGAGIGGKLTTVAGTYVTSWALRSVLEPVAGYGWTWETIPGGAAAGASSIVAELSSLTGNFRTKGAMSAVGGFLVGDTGYSIKPTGEASVLALNVGNNRATISQDGVFAGVGTNLTGTAAGLTAGVANFAYRAGATDNLPAVVMNSDGSYYGQIGRYSTQEWGLGRGNGGGAAMNGYALTWNASGTTTVRGALCGVIQQGSYGSITVGGATNGWAGINFSDYYRTFMVNAAAQGVYADNGTWQWRFDNGVLAVGSVPGASVLGPVGSADRISGTSLTLGGSTVTTTAYLGMWFNNGDPNYWIGKRQGTWPQPLDLAFYTGIRYHAHMGYGGHRFFALGYDSGEVFSVGNGDNNVRVMNTIFAYSYRGNSNVAGTGEASYHPAGIFSQGTNWLYGPIITNGNSIQTGGGTIYCGTLAASGDVYAYYSDARLKTDIRPIQGALAKVLAIRGILYRANDLAASYGYLDRSEKLGVLAQDVEIVAPQVVVPAGFDLEVLPDGSSRSKSGQHYKTVQYDKLVPLLIEAIREQQGQIDALRRRLDGAAC